MTIREMVRGFIEAFTIGRDWAATPVPLVVPAAPTATDAPDEPTVRVFCILDGTPILIPIARIGMLKGFALCKGCAPRVRLAAEVRADAS